MNIKKSFEYNELFPLNNINNRSIYTSFICIRNKWIKYDLAKWTKNPLRFIIPNTTVQFISIYNTEKELIENVYLDENYFNYTYEFNKINLKNKRFRFVFRMKYVIYKFTNLFLFNF